MDLTSVVDFAIPVILVVIAAISFYKITGRIKSGNAATSRWVLMFFWIAVVAVLMYFIMSLGLSENKVPTIAFGILIILTISTNLSMGIVARIGGNWGYIKKASATAAISILLGFVLILMISIFQSAFH